MKNEKVAMMTWYKNRNYGTVLQCYALYNNIKKLGYDPIVINYEKKNNKYKFPKTVKAYKRAINVGKRYFIKNYDTEEKKALFEKFITNNISETKVCCNYTELYQLNKEYSKFVCGSDQVWTPTETFDDKYYLSFVEDDCLKISYAPSFGVNKIQFKEQEEIIKGLLNRFDHISTREIRGAEIVGELIGTKPKVVLDPTLLNKKDEWEQLQEVQNSVKLEGDYIICYFLGDYKKYLHNVKEISKELGIPYYIIPILKKHKLLKEKVPFEVGPGEFVSLIKNSKYVCTDSFHGLLFAVNFNVPFSIYERFKKNDAKGENSRIYSILELLGLESRLSNNTYKIDVDYDNVNRKLEILRDESLSYLELALAHNKEKKKNYLSQSLCNGCGACATICPTKSISVDFNKDGFLHYKIDSEKCINCGQCKSVCPVVNLSVTNLNMTQKIVAYKSENSDVLRKSSSGGAAYEIGLSVIKEGGIVFGVEYNTEKCRAEHIMATTLDELKRTQGSKYIQSIVGNKFEECISLAKSGHKVAFFGTPCQTSGLHNLLIKNGLRDKVLLVELVCHGVTSINVWDKYLRELIHKYKISGNVECRFRDKEFGWSQKTMTLSYNGRKDKLHFEDNKDLFYSVFYYPIAYMETCYECQYRNSSSADLRIGDFWGEEYKHDKTGVSMIDIITDKGQEIVDNIEGNIIKEYSPYCYDTIQRYKNPAKPILYKSIINDIVNDNNSLKDIRRIYIKDYINEKKKAKVISVLVKIKRYIKGKNFIGKR